MTDAILSGLLLGFALVFSVGPVIFTLIKLRINYGVVSAFYFVAGVWLSDIIWVLAANLFSGLLQTLNTNKSLIGVFGGFFLIALGIFYLFFKKYHTKEEMDKGVKIAGTTHLRLFITGFLINTLNPGVIALWFAVATKSLNDPFNERFVIFTTCLLVNMGADLAKINLAGRLRKKLTDHNIVIINKISGLMFLLFGVALIIGVFYSTKH
ncbi:MAG: LysE family transporter [Sphingobacteriales bacterium]|jgi:threonine/homoserine/homoserine lactone efflux protein|nr:LysE family transporter [Sphingobacteriales bacterium]